MIWVLGDIAVDVLARHAAPLAHGSDTLARTTLEPGGAAGNVAAWLAAEGADARLAGCVGDDALAPVALRGLDDAHVRWVPGVATATVVVLVGPDGERTMLPDWGANARLVPDDVPDLRPGDTLYVSGYLLLREATRSVARRALDEARAVGARTVLDPASAAPLAAAPGIVAAAGPFDLLLPNAAEAAVLGEAGLRAGRELVVTAGADGAAWHGPLGADGARPTVHVPAAVAQDAVVDTTGAGDAFAAGFVAAWATGAAPGDALAAGTTLAARAVTRAGARPAP